MVKGYSTGPMVVNMKETIKMIKKKVKEYFTGPMDESMKDSG